MVTSRAAKYLRFAVAFEQRANRDQAVAAENPSPHIRQCNVLSPLHNLAERSAGAVPAVLGARDNLIVGSQSWKCTSRILVAALPI